MDLADTTQDALSLENLTEFSDELITLERKNLVIYAEQLGIFFIER